MISHKRISTGDTNAVSVTAEPTRLLFVDVSNVNAAVRYIKIYNKASVPTVGTDVPRLTIPVEGGTTGKSTFRFYGDKGLDFSAGLGFCMTTEATDAGSTGVSADQHVIMLGYEVDP